MRAQGLPLPPTNPSATATTTAAAPAVATCQRQSSRQGVVPGHLPHSKRESEQLRHSAVRHTPEPPGSHPQESHEPVHHVEDHRSYGDSANHRLVADVTNNGQIDKSQQRYGDICHYRRHCQPQYFLIPLIHFALQR